MKYSSIRLTVYFIIIMIACCAGCAKKPFRAKSQTPPPIIYCFDTIGHIADNKPYILGGKCLCTPNEKNLVLWQADGYFTDMTVEAVRQMYIDKGYKLMDENHRYCNNCCQYGPHAVEGGHCFVPPTPGTTHYEQIASGQFLQIQTDKK